MVSAHFWGSEDEDLAFLAAELLADPGLVEPDHIDGSSTVFECGCEHDFASPEALGSDGGDCASDLDGFCRSDLCDGELLGSVLVAPWEVEEELADGDVCVLVQLVDSARHVRADPF